AALTRALVAVVLAALAAVVAGSLSGELDASRLAPPWHGGAYGILQAAGLLFFAFAGYARIATLGEEVREPERIIPRAIPLALGAIVAVTVALVDLRSAIGFSSFAVLVYYAIANAAALTLRRRRWLPAFGVLGCVALAVTLPATAAAAGAGVLAAGALAYAIR